MHALVGRAITRWSFVEERLCGVFMVATSPYVAYPGGGVHYLSSQVPTAIFFALEGFRAKLSIVDAAMSNLLFSEDSKCLREEWLKLKAKCVRLSRNRNKLAHWTVSPAFEEDDKVYPARLLPPYGSLAYWQETGAFPQGKALTPHNMEALEKAFHMLGERIQNFVQALALSDELFDRTCFVANHQMRNLKAANSARADRLRQAWSDDKEC